MLVLYCRELVVTLQEFCIDSWKSAFLFFLKEVRMKYQMHIFLTKKSTTKYNYSGVSKQESMYNAFKEVTLPCAILFVIFTKAYCLKIVTSLLVAYNLHNTI